MAPTYSITRSTNRFILLGNWEGNICRGHCTRNKTHPQLRRSTPARYQCQNTTTHVGGLFCSSSRFSIISFLFHAFVCNYVLGVVCIWQGFALIASHIPKNGPVRTRLPFPTRTVWGFNAASIRESNWTNINRKQEGTSLWEAVIKPKVACL